jgi:RsmE family RNA methyltransferase
VNLILLEPDEVDAAGVAVLSDGRAAHLIGVLNVAPGQPVRIGLIDGPAGTGTVVDTAGGTVRVRCEFEEAVPPEPVIDLLLAPPRPKVMRRLWAQLAALGVGRIILTNAARVERNYFDTHVLTPACFRPLLIEGLQQARDTRLPAVSIHRRFRVLIEDDLDALFGAGLRLAAHPGVEDSMHAVVAAHPRERMLVAIGPEGGWNDFELALLQARGFQLVGTGPRTLRTDTACVALLALAHDARTRAAAGDLARGGTHNPASGGTRGSARGGTRG